MIVNDHRRRIRYYHLGWPGNVHDKRVYRHKPLAKKPEQYFSTDKIMLADSAFIPPKNVVPCFKKKGHKMKMPKAKEQFNTIIAKLKCRFCFLQ